MSVRGNHAPLSTLAAQLDEYAAHKVNATSWMFPVDVTIDLPDGVRCPCGRKRVRSHQPDSGGAS
ncbi:MAG: hypothetical protein ACLSVD_03000 [Eggerthellaceae bacterium]